MTSWRDSATQSAQDDLDGLLNLVLPHAEDLLRRRGEFYPFGATVSMDGTTALIGADPGLGRRPPPDQVLAGLYQGVQGDAASLRAAAFVADVRVGRSDAIRVELEHRDGVAPVVLVPYTPSRSNRPVKLGSMSAVAGEPRVWTSLT
ncbi:hypothetical protein [Nocardioides sp. T2.26MG-1]|uniref:hypothetical protein n=1 Tax=Nocardioides sp. T2.26MG-1 TaxID=3041166 RepID=UPI0024778360|nr:hypothetical protein [Nocardioides sp. T2.26MG-1]CAI9415393.1 hypothetical protein HIDPHFAB_02509 [Nocardioides sp. T2.26MG-1]